jgi:hypothetical protein
MNLLVIIGDLVESRAIADRQALQNRLGAALDHTRAAPEGIASPYTLTLGDEFQAVLSEAERAFRDAVAIQAAVHPVLVRFSLAVGTLSTAINPRQALAMDGPAFHQARAGIEAMKAEDSLFRVHGLDADSAALANASLSLISHAFRKWQPRRVRILAALQHGTAVPEIARQQGVSEQAVYKNVSDGRLRDVLAAFTAIGRLLNRALGA